MSIKDDVARRVTLKAQQDRINEELALIDARLREAGYGTHDAGEWTLQVSHNRRLDTARIEQRFPVAQYPHLYKPSVDTAAVKDNFAPVELEQYYLEGAPRVLVK